MVKKQVGNYSLIVLIGRKTSLHMLHRDLIMVVLFTSTDDDNCTFGYVHGVSLMYTNHTDTTIPTDGYESGGERFWQWYYQEVSYFEIYCEEVKDLLSPEG